MSCEVLERPPKGAKTVAHTRAFRHRALPGLKPSRVKVPPAMPRRARFGDRCPESFVVKGGTAQMRLVVSIGRHQLIFGFRKNERGLVEFHELQQLKNVRIARVIGGITRRVYLPAAGPPLGS